MKKEDKTSKGEIHPQNDENSQIQTEANKQILNNTSTGQQDKIRKTIIRAEQYSGPLPSPKDLKAYQDILPDAPERILTMAEKQQNHRIELENQIVKSGIRESKQGQWTGTILAFAFLFAVYLGIKSHDWLAGIIIGILASVLVIMVLHKEPKNKDDQPSKENIS